MKWCITAGIRGVNVGTQFAHHKPQLLALGKLGEAIRRCPRQQMRHNRREGHYRDGGVEHVDRVPNSAALARKQPRAKDWPSRRLAVQQHWVRVDPLDNVPQRRRLGVDFEARQLPEIVCRLGEADCDAAASGRHFCCLNRREG